MGKKIFISYSHRDEIHKEALVEHLSTLRQNGEITDWHDRKIVPSQNWSEEISENLEKSKIIIFLISSSFLDSNYCQNIEAKKAIKMHKQGRAKLIPIVVRPCEWENHELSQFQGLPKDALAVTQWQNADEAWVDVVKGLKESLKLLDKSQPAIQSEMEMVNSFSISKETINWLDSTEITLTHRKVDKIKLSDIYVSPDIEFDIDVEGIDLDIVGSDSLLIPGKYLLSGEEQQGKTTLLKNYYLECLKKSVIPIYLDVTNLRKSDLNKILKKSLKKQFDNLSLEEYNSHKNKIIFIDNFDAIGLNTEHRNKFLGELETLFDWIVITCHSSYSYISAETPGLAKYKKGEILGFGNHKREQIAQKWISLGQEESISEKDLYQRCDEIKSQLNTIIKKNIVPPKPVFILMIMQMFEAHAQQNIELTSYGHCYQQLIYKSLENANVKHTEYHCCPINFR